MGDLFNRVRVCKALFAAAFFIYAFFSSPTPDSFSVAEIAIAGCLLLSLRIRFSSDAVPGFVLAAYGLSLPVLISFIYGYPLIELIRDVIPFLFLLMPIFSRFQNANDSKFLSAICIIVGLVFSIRSLATFGANIFEPREWLGTPPDLLYLANSPEVLFSAVMLLAVAFRPDKISVRIGCLVLACLPLLAMASLMQRASLFYLIGCASISLVILLWKAPRRAVFIVIIAGLGLFSAYSFLDEIFRQLSFKTQMVGLNSRGAEWKAVIEQVSQSPLSFVFGLGWGAEFENPAVGGLRVSFTHSLLSSLLLKTGITGVVLFLVYGFGVLKKSFLRLSNETIYLYALMGPLLIGLMLYASYKSLGYGLLFLILASLAQENESGKRLDETRLAVP